MAIGCKIVREIDRADTELVKLFQDIPVANIDDCMGRIAAIDSAIRPIGPAKLCGTAFTVRVSQGDNLMFHAAMDLAQPGDIIVIDAGGFEERAIFGELMASYCRKRGISGIVCDGAIRDAGAISEMKDFPVYARAITPNGPYKNGVGEINIPVVVGGKLVRPGDIIVGDDDGIVIISPDIAREVALAAAEIQKKESKIMQEIVEQGTYVRPWVEAKLKELGCEFG